MKKANTEVFSSSREAVMAESVRTRATARSPRRSTTASAAWKSGLLATSFGAVLLGWMLLVRTEGPANAALLAQSQSSVFVSQVPADDQSRQFSEQSSRSRLTVPSLPQAPVFQRPITRSRAS